MIEPEVSPEDVKRHDGKAVEMIHRLKPGEAARYADLIRTAKVLDELDGDDVADL